MSTQIRVKYEQLEEAGRRFEAQAEMANQLHQTVVAASDTVLNGQWAGEAAEAYAAEAEGEALPALVALASALARAKMRLNEISRLLYEAEQDAAQGMKQASVPAIQSVGPGQPVTPANEGHGGHGLSLYEWVKVAKSPVSLLRAYGRLLPGRETSSWVARVLEKVLPGQGKLAKAVASNRWLGLASRGLSALSVGTSGAAFLQNPDVERGADLVASGVGLYGALGSGLLAPLASAFAAGYTIGDVAVPDTVKEWAGDRLTDWDPFDLQNGAINYPRTTINHYQRHGRDMPLDVARDVFVGLTHEYGIDDANSFAWKYAKEHSMSVRKFQSGLPWYHQQLSYMTGFNLLEGLELGDEK